MCLNCGCGELDERHGNEANIVRDDLRRAGEANGQDVATTLRNLQASLGSLSEGDWTQIGMAGAASARGGLGRSTGSTSTMGAATAGESQATRDR